MSLLYYKRPDYVEKSTAPMAASDYRTYLERQRASIPPELCFEYVIANRAVPVRPITTFLLLSLSIPLRSSYPSFSFYLFLIFIFIRFLCSLCVFFFSFFLFFFFLFCIYLYKNKNKNSHVHYSISPAICSMSRMMPRTSSSTCAFSIIRNDSFNAQGEIRPFRRRGNKMTTTTTPS